MTLIPVHFTYRTGVVGDPFPGANARLLGSWNSKGLYDPNWTSSPMVAGLGEDGCLCYRTTVKLDDSQLGRSFSWGVSFAWPDGNETWMIPTEIKDRDSKERFRSFQLSKSGLEEVYHLTHCRRLGANKVVLGNKTGIRFSVWAPNALKVETLCGTVWDRNDPTRTPCDAAMTLADISGGYIANDGTGQHPKRGPFAMMKDAEGVWSTDVDDKALQDFASFDHKPYLFRVTQSDGTVAYRTDLYSRCQIGYGSNDPQGAPYSGLISDLDGKVGCSVVVDPERVTQYFQEEQPWMPTASGPRVWPERFFIPTSDFWKDEFTNRKLPKSLSELVIYELFLGALGFGSNDPGTLEDALKLLDHIESLGVNAIELLPLSEFGGGGLNWGYATSHHFAIEFAGGGRDQYKCFVKECHRRGIAVIVDVVYNHYSHSAERAEYHYDSNQPEQDIYYWYEGTPSQYAQPNGGYVDNMSTAYAPRYHEEMVRKLFISSAVALIKEFHVDGFRVDQTTSIHSYNVLHADGRAVPNANIFGAKFLREYSRTLHLFKPDVLLMAEDHSTWDQVTLPCEDGGMGFDARWYADFYHHLAGDTNKGSDYAKLMYTAATQPGIALAMDYFAGALSATGDHHVVYNESHDEAGNSQGPFPDPNWTDKEKKATSHRSIVVAANAAPLVAATRSYAEARCRFGLGMTLLSAGTPMILFGEEVGAEKRFKYDHVIDNKEDILGLAKGSGAKLYRFYQALIRLRVASPVLRSNNIDVLYVHNANRVLLFRRWSGAAEYLVAASLNDQPFDQGYDFAGLRLADANWRELFNSDATEFGGINIGNAGGVRSSHSGNFGCVIPFNGFVIFEKT